MLYINILLKEYVYDSYLNYWIYFIIKRWYNIGKKRFLVSHQKGEKLHRGESNSFNGYPNSNRDSYRYPTGEIHRRRKFDINGYAYLDYDYADDTHEKDHIHDIVGEVRKPDRNPTKKERKEMLRAKKKVLYEKDGVWKLKKRKFKQ